MTIKPCHTAPWNWENSKYMTKSASRLLKSCFYFSFSWFRQCGSKVAFGLTFAWVVLLAVHVHELKVLVWCSQLFYQSVYCSYLTFDCGVLVCVCAVKSLIINIFFWGSVKWFMCSFTLGYCCPQLTNSFPGEKAYANNNIKALSGTPPFLAAYFSHISTLWSHVCGFTFMSHKAVIALVTQFVGCCLVITYGTWAGSSHLRIYHNHWSSYKAKLYQ